MASREGGPVQSLDRAFDVLETLARSHTSMGVSELGTHVGLPKPTVHRLLNALVQRGYVRQDPHTRRYEPTLRLTTMGSLVIKRTPMFRHAALPLRRLAREAGCTAALAVPDPPATMLVLDVVEHDRLPFSVDRGACPMWESVAGWVWAAYLPPEQQERLLQSVTDQNWPGSRDEILARWNAIRSRGYELRYPIQNGRGWALAMPVRGRGGESSAVIVLSGPEDNAPVAGRLQELRQLLEGTTAEISAGMGFLVPTVL